ncbi:MAG: ABC transporter substrate-binding protein [Burkholderiales bacterium]|nr:ABC transporter substrate-binding protein [Burkholderiales bacterium]
MTLRVAVPDLVSPSYFPVITAVDLGFFGLEGFDATVETVFPVTRAYEELRAGRFDLVAGAAHAVLYAFPNWSGCRLLAALAKQMYWFLVVRSDLGAERGDASVVKGLRIGAAPGPVDGLRQLLSESGIDPERDVTIGPVPGTAGTGVSFGVAAARALAEGRIDGFWAGGMGAEIAVRDGTGTLVLDVRRGDGPAGARDYTFPALAATERTLAGRPDQVGGAIRALVRAQEALRADPALAAEVGRTRFRRAEAEMIAELVRRDAPFYDPFISQWAVTALNGFARSLGLLTAPAPYEQVVATEFQHLWHAGGEP